MGERGYPTVGLSTWEVGADDEAANVNPRVAQRSQQMPVIAGGSAGGLREPIIP
jgi:hypothetical protein